jgi:copper(I)-binding protein
MNARCAVGSVAVVLAWLAMSTGGCAGSDEPSAGSDEPSAGIRAESAWVRAVSVRVAGGPVNTAAYMMLVNAGQVTDSLVGASTPAARLAEVHRTQIDEEGLATMGPAGPLAIAPFDSVLLEPGGLHIMLMGVAESLTPGDTVEIGLLFGSGLDVTVQAEVRPY